jgi:sulfur dioxygenase
MASLLRRSVRRAQAGLNREQQQGIVAAAERGGAIGRAKLKVHGVEDYAALMASLRLPDPKMMDVAVPANMRQGLHQEEVARRGWAYSTDEAKGLVGRRVALINLREKAERDRAGTIPGSVHGPLRRSAGQYRRPRPHARNDRQDDRLLLRFRRALGHGSAGRPGLATARHIEGRMAAWLTAGGEAG